MASIDNLLLSFLYTTKSQKEHTILRLMQQPKRRARPAEQCNLIYREGAGAGMADLLGYFEVLEVLVLEGCPGVDSLARV